MCVCFGIPSSSSPLTTPHFLLLSSLSLAAALDVAVLSHALRGLAAKAGERSRHAIDLLLCLPPVSSMPFSLAAVAEWGKLTEYRVALNPNCLGALTTIPPHSSAPGQQSPRLFLILPHNTQAVGKSVEKISRFYQQRKTDFLSGGAGSRLLWTPIFLVMWPNVRDYCAANDSVTETLIRGIFSPGRTPHLPVNSDLYLFFGSECWEQRDNVWEVYVLEHQLLVQKLVPDGRPHENLYMGLLGRVRRRRDLEGALIRAVTAKDPSSFLRDPPSGAFNPLDIRNGTPHVVFNELRQALNFSSKIILGDWIRRHRNGTLKGRTASLFRRGLADVTLSLSSLLPYRKAELSFLQPTLTDSVHGFFVQPAAYSFRDIVSGPFSTSLWVCLILSYLLLVASLATFHYVLEKVAGGRQGTEEVVEEEAMFHDELLLWAVGALTQKGWHCCPERVSSRVAFLVGYLLGLISYGAFSAAVVSILAVDLKPISDRKELLSSSLTFYADNQSSTMAYLVNYLRNTTTLTWGPPAGVDEGVRRLKNWERESACYLAFPQYFYRSAEVTGNVTESWMCEKLSVISVSSSATPSAMVVTRDSEWAELLNFVILQMLGRGLNWRFSKMWKQVTGIRCEGQDPTVFHPLEYHDLLTAFLIVAGGAVLATLILAAETLFRCGGKGSEGPTRFAIEGNWIR